MYDLTEYENLDEMKQGALAPRLEPCTKKTKKT